MAEICIIIVESFTINDYAIMGITITFEFHVHISRSEKDSKQTSWQIIKQHDRQTENTEENDSTALDFIERAEGVVKRLKESMSKSAVDNYQTALRSLRRYLGNVTNRKLDNQAIKGFERWLRDRQLSLNSISCYMRSLRSLCSKMNDLRLSEAFDNVYTGRETTEKRAVSESDISKVKRVEIKRGSFMRLARDLFLFSFYARGMPFVDLAFLHQSQISDGVLTYHRHKTGQRVMVRLEPCMLDILSRYQRDGQLYVFPLLQSEDPQKAYLEYLNRLNQYNRSLKAIAKKAGVTSRLTSYTTRHTWASVAYNSDVDLPIISKALGHTNTQTTLTYIKEINDSRLDVANRLLVSRI